MPYEEREYACPKCAHHGLGHRVLQKSPPQFFLQPHPNYPQMETGAVNYHGVFVIKQSCLCVRRFE